MKSFEHVYELSIHLVRRAPESKAVSSAEIDEMDFETLIRTAAEKGLMMAGAPRFLLNDPKILCSEPAFSLPVTSA